MLYQQGTQRIEVIVRKDMTGDSGVGAKEQDASETPEVSNEKQQTSLGAPSRRTQRIVRANTMHILMVAKQTIGLAIDYWVGGIGFRNGDQAQQDRIERQIEQVTDVTNLASSVAFGAASNAWAGLPGMVIGAVTGAVSNITSTSAKYAKREREYSFKMMKENNSIEYNRARAGLIDFNGRVR